MLFAAVAALGYAMVQSAGAAAIWWPPSGAAIAWLFSRKRREWGQVLVLAFLIRLGVAATLGRSTGLSALVIAGSLASNVVAALVLQRLLAGRTRLAEPYDVISLAGVALFVAGPLAAAWAALYRAALAGGDLVWWSPVHWAMGDAVGVVLAGPFLLTLNDAVAWWKRSSLACRLELLALLLVTFVGAWQALYSPLDESEFRRPLLGLLLLPPVWAALRIGIFAASWTQVIIGVIGARGLIVGAGVIMALPSSHDRHVLLFQVYELVLALASLLIAAAFESQRAALAKVRESEAQFRRLVDDAPVALLVEHTARAERPYLNPRLVALLGPAPADGDLEAWWDRTGVMPAVRAALDEAAEHFGTQSYAGVTTDLLGSDGATRHVELNVSIAGDRRITAFTDLTERTRLEAELRQATKLEALGTLAGGVAHDFNNLLGAVLGNLALAQRSLGQPSEALALLREAERAGQRATAVARQILTFSRRENEARHVVTLGPVLHEAVSILRGAAGPGVRVEVHEGNDVPTVWGDTTQLHQLIVNLGTNALHAMRTTGGTLTVALDAVTVTSADLRLGRGQREGRHARLVVRDTGHGMPPETLERVFEPFFTTKALGEGTGLGLAVVHGVVRGHDGTIMATSAPGAGASFEVLIPAAVTPVSVPIITEAEAPTARGLRVLVVDDEHSLARLAERALQRAECTVTSLTSAGDALALLTAHADEFDVLVTDLTMPEMSGLELVAEMRKVRVDLPVLLVSGYSVMLTEEQLEVEGIAAVLSKPYSPDEISRVRDTRGLAFLVTDIRSDSPDSTTQRWVVETILFTAVAAMGYALVTRPGEPAVWWPATGAAVSWFFSRSRRDWPIVFALAVTMRLLIVTTIGNRDPLAIVTVVGSVGTNLVAAYVLQRVLAGRRRLAEPYDVVRFTAVAVFVAGALSAAFAAVYRMFEGGESLRWWSSLHWIMGDALAVVVLGPFLLTLPYAGQWWRRARARRRFEVVALCALVLGMIWTVSVATPDVAEVRRPILGLVLLPMLWAALRVGSFAVTWLLLIVTFVAGRGLVAGSGVFAALPGPHERHVLLFQTYSLVLAFATQLVAAAFESQRSALALARRTESKFRRLVDDAPVALLVEPVLGGEPPYLNPRLVTLLGALPEPGGLEAWWERAGATRAVRSALGSTALQPGAHAPVAADLRDATGATRHLELHVSLAGDSRITAFTDLTDRLRLEGELRQANKLEALGTLAGGVAHDFNNLLAIVIGNLAHAQKSLDRPVEARALLAEAERASQHAAGVARQILTFSRRDSETRQLVRLASVMQDAVTLLRASAPTRVPVEMHVARDLPPVLGDATQLHQVIVNLGTNAIHAMREQGGTLQMSLDALELTEADVRAGRGQRQGRHVRLVVRDSGHGIPPATLERIFEPFFTTKPLGEGTGLGLAVVHGVVRGLGGTITASSTVGVGTTFEVLVPATESPEATPVPSVRVRPTARGMRVLIADDERALVRIAERTLTRAECRVVAVTSSAEALERLRADPDGFDVLVTDLTMPGMDGLELAAAMREVKADLKVLLVSGYSAML
ncbi:MAG: MASE1 domain-containing protein [Gemmatimonadetes bacterium]|nr:MASE1 domain-containing protein [Gemmatimonadota bacterium]